MTVEEDFKRWTAHRKAALVTETLEGRASVSEAARSFALSPSEIEDWVDEGKKGLENARRAKPLDIKEHYERQLKELQKAYEEAMFELRARKKLVSLLGEEEKRFRPSSRDCDLPPLSRNKVMAVGPQILENCGYEDNTIYR